MNEDYIKEIDWAVVEHDMSISRKLTVTRDNSVWLFDNFNDDVGLLAIHILSNPHDDEALMAFIAGVKSGKISPVDRSTLEPIINKLLNGKN
jgi:hypothetical protein